jgi:hypothetical protein
MIISKHNQINLSVAIIVITIETVIARINLNNSTTYPL